MTVVTVGIDLAKNVFAIHGVDKNGKPVLVKPKVPRAALSELIVLPLCIIGIEACSCTRYWVRLHHQTTETTLYRCIDKVPFLAEGIDVKELDLVRNICKTY